VTPIKREMINDQKLSSLVVTTSGSVLAQNLVHLSTPSTIDPTTSQVVDRKRSVVHLEGPSSVTPPPPCKYLAVTTVDDDDEKSCIPRLMSPQSGETLLSPNTEQDLADALSALAGSSAMEAHSLPPISEAETVWNPSTDYEGDLNVVGDEWSELVVASCDRLLTSTDDDDTLSDGGSLSDYQRLIPSPAIGPSAARDNDDTEARSERVDLASDTMWCNWAPETDLGSLLSFGP